LYEKQLNKLECNKLSKLPNMNVAKFILLDDNYLFKALNIGF